MLSIRTKNGEYKTRATYTAKGWQVEVQLTGKWTKLVAVKPSIMAAYGNTLRAILQWEETQKASPKGNTSKKSGPSTASFVEDTALAPSTS